MRSLRDLRVLRGSKTQRSHRDAKPSRRSSARSQRALPAANARHTHPAMKHTPPIGVMAPSARTPVNVIAYNDPVKKSVPATNSQPALVANPLGQRLASETNRDQGQCVVHLVPRARFKDLEQARFDLLAQRVRAEGAGGHADCARKRADHQESTVHTAESTRWARDRRTRSCRFPAP